MPEHKAWSKAVSELLALHETFRRLGFPAEELFVHAYQGGQIQFALMRNGEQFTIDIERVPDVAALQKEWAEALEWWNTKATNGEMQHIYHFSKTKMDQPLIVTALQKRKFLPL